LLLYLSHLNVYTKITFNQSFIVNPLEKHPLKLFVMPIKQFRVKNSLRKFCSAGFWAIKQCRVKNSLRKFCSAGFWAIQNLAQG